MKEVRKTIFNRILAQRSNQSLRLVFLCCAATVVCFLVVARMETNGKYLLRRKHPLAVSLQVAHREFVPEKVRIRDQLYLDYIEMAEKLDRIVGTKRKKRLPDIIGIGAEKCGTGALRWMLVQHPMILSSDPKEIHFFSTRQYEKGMEYYKSFMPDVADYELVFEKSPTYLDKGRDTPKRMKEGVPNAKLIVVLCNPLNRTFSDFAHEIKMNMIPEDSNFETTLDQLLAMLTPKLSSLRDYDDVITEMIQTMRSSYPNSHILTTGMYYYHMRRWFKEYNQSDIHIVDGEKVISNPGAVIEEVQEYLGIPKLIIAEDFVRGNSDFYCLAMPRIDRSSDRVAISGKMKPTCLGKYAKGRTRMGHWDHKPSNLAVSKLKKFYAPFNEKLFSLIGREFNWL